MANFRVSRMPNKMTQPHKNERRETSFIIKACSNQVGQKVFRKIGSKEQFELWRTWFKTKTKREILSYLINLYSNQKQGEKPNERWFPPTRLGCRNNFFWAHQGGALIRRGLTKFLKAPTALILKWGLEEILGNNLCSLINNMPASVDNILRAE